MRIVKHIKIRIGEPLTAVASNEKGIAFGSISGYIGYYCRTRKEVYYVKEVFEELIRSIQFITPDTAYACVGDECGLILNFRDVERIVYDVIQYTKSHNLSQCPNTIPFLHNHTCLLVPFPSTNTKETQIESYYKQSSWLIDYEDRSQNDIGKIAIASFSVPYGFNGRKLLWLEYHENKEKVLTTYDINKQTVDKIHTFAPKSGYDFIAHVKWYNEQLVLVKNLKTVEILDPATEKVQQLYQHNSHIIALEIFHPKTPETTPHFDKDIEIGFKPEEEKFSDQELKSANRSLTVVSIDYSELLYFYEGNRLNKVELRKLPGFPDLPKNTYLFDMGYPYYICIDSKSITFTSDIGLFIIDYV